MGPREPLRLMSMVMHCEVCGLGRVAEEEGLAASLSFRIESCSGSPPRAQVKVTAHLSEIEGRTA